MFLIYINDITESSKVLKDFLIADDTTIFFSHRDIQKVDEIINSELVNVTDWLIANKLSLNAKKSNVLLFRYKNESNINQLNININNEMLKEQTCTKYLGIVIDNKLTFEEHVKYVNTKLIKANAILANIRHFVPENVLRNICNAHIQPHLGYESLIWGYIAPTYFNIIKESKKKAMRIMNFNYKDTPVNPFFINSKILPLKENLKFLQGKFMWRVVHRFLLESILNIFAKHDSTRETNKDINRLNLPTVNTEHAKNFITFSGATFLNKSIPNNFTQINTPNLFNKELKTFLFNSLDCCLNFIGQCLRLLV